MPGVIRAVRRDLAEHEHGHRASVARTPTSAPTRWRVFPHSASSSRRESFGEANALHRAGDAAPRVVVENDDASHEGKSRRPGAPDLTSRDHAPAIFLFVRHFVRRGALRPLAHGYPVFLRWSPAPA